MKISIRIAILALLLVASCSKPDDDDDDQNTPILTKTKTELLMGGKWQMFSEKQILITDSLVDSTETTINDMEQCETDDRILFNAGGRVVILRGNVRCEPDEAPQETVSLWKLTDGDTRLLLGEDSTAEAYQVLELSAATLKLSLNEGDSSEGDFSRIELTL
jgi:hypothetical protein